MDFISSSKNVGSSAFGSSGNASASSSGGNVFSNLTIDHTKFKKQIDQLQQIKLKANLNQLHLICSIDCWGDSATYVRNGLNLDLFEKNFNYVLHNTDIILNINSTLGPLTIPSLPDLVDKINTWSQVRTVYWSLMKTGGYNFFHPTIFGPKLLDLGYRQAIEQFNDDTIIKPHTKGKVCFKLTKNIAAATNTNIGMDGIEFEVSDVVVSSNELK